ncbi:MAG: hypothetical protein E6R10_00185 [Rhodocyclaceae bacterium]|nr:MAG: hypothetical protein E6R10_00185 [Rhodocyclaceae bacterium]
MKTLADKRTTIAWTLLMLGTLATWAMGAAGLTGPWVALAILAIAFVKGRLVILDFMELRHAPLMWRLILEGWMVFVSALILIAYGLSLK